MRAVWQLLFCLLLSFQKQAVNATEDNNSNDEEENKKIVHEVNSAGTTWRASLTSKFLKYDEVALNMLAGTIPREVGEYGEEAVGNSPPSDLKKRMKLPKNFDAREQWPDCKSIGYIRDQGPCGGCWAISVAQVATDRYCIQTGQKHNPIFSYAELLTCSDSGTCHGGREDGSWDYLISHGVVTGGQHHDQDTCYPSPFPLCDHHQAGNYQMCPPADKTPDCARKCVGKKSEDSFETSRYKAEKYWDLYGEKQLMKELYKRGPVSIAMRVNKDFYFYSDGVYQHITGPFIGFHAVRLIGWGVDDGTPYWVITNTWNNDWGEKGVIRVKRGHGYLGITSGLAGTMALPEFGVAVSWKSSAVSWSLLGLFAVLLFL